LTASRIAVAALVTLGLASGCGSSSGNDGGAGPSSSAGGAAPGTVTVFAAASLTESFTALGQQFETANPNTSVRFNFAGSSALATQINEGAPADVFASAAPKNMADVTDAGTPVTFARNQLVIAVSKGNPQGITALPDLTRAGLKVALCAEAVPCGAASRTVLEAGGVRLTPVTLEQDVKAALAKLKLGEVDAALVYRTDAKASAADVDPIEFPESAKAVNDYPITVLKDARNRAGAQAFVDFVLSADGTKVLTEAGFQAP
jgi:molybdate transport system substrate-binding protein